MTAHRRILFCSLALALGSHSCKRQQASQAPAVWDEAPSERESTEIGELTPPWPTPTKTALGNGLLGYWLYEPQAGACHVRILLPFDAGSPASEVVQVVAEAARHDLERRLARYPIEAITEYGPGRVELVVRGPNAELPRIIAQLGQTLGAAQPGTGLVAAQKRLASQALPLESTHVAIATLVSTLLPDVPSDLVSPARLAETPKLSLTLGWHALLDPRRAVLVIHAAAPPKAAMLAPLAERWTGRGRPPSAGDSAVARLRPAPATTKPPAQTTAPDEASPWRLDVAQEPALGGATLVVGRVVSTPRWQDRTFARLAQRIAQEELDVRLVVAGERAIWVVVLPLSGPDPSGELEATLDRLSELAQARQPRQRLFQAAQLWLGGRIVQASLDGEDWTALFSEAVDLSDSDREIETALARDARSMLAADPEQLQAWQRAELDPRTDRSPWRLVLAGAPPRVLKDLDAITTRATIE